jgi:cathepsin B
MRCQASFTRDYRNDLWKGKEVFNLPSKNVLYMQKEIMTNGPIVAEIKMYQDFKKYKGKGVYKQRSGVAKGAHAIKIIGWGVERGVPFWTILNSWGKSW